MRFLLKRAVLFFLFFFGLSVYGAPDSITIDDFAKGVNSDWKEEKIEGRTKYCIVMDGEKKCLRAESDDSNSALYYNIEYNVKDYPFIEWQWKIDHVLKKGNAKTKEGCDCPARIYIVFKSGFLWRSKTLGYFWASSIPKGEIIKHPYNKNGRMIAVESGDEKAGEWITEKRNLLEDFKLAFGEDPPDVRAIAIQTDTDNTNEKATAWYGKIRILSKQD